MKTERQGWAVRAVGRTWQGVMALILGILLFCQGWEYYAKAALPWPNWLCLLAGAGGMALMAGAARLILRRTRSPKKRLLCVAGVSAVMAGAIFYCSAHYAVTPSWDPAYVYFDAGNLSGIFGESLSNDYYSRYPNNLLITLAFSLFMTALVVFVPFLRTAFSFATIGPREYLTAMAIALGIIPIVELLKLMERRAERKPS